MEVCSWERKEMWVQNCETVEKKGKEWLGGEEWEKWINKYERETEPKQTLDILRQFCHSTDPNRERGQKAKQSFPETGDWMSANTTLP